MNSGRKVTPGSEDGNELRVAGATGLDGVTWGPVLGTPPWCLEGQQELAKEMEKEQP